jgi:hypothetical protein
MVFKMIAKERPPLKNRIVVYITAKEKWAHWVSGHQICVIMTQLDLLFDM